MSSSVQVSPWAAEQFGDLAETVVRAVVESLEEAHEAGLRTQGASSARHNRPYGSMWPERYDVLVSKLRGERGVEILHPRGASYDLPVINGRVLFPFRHSDNLAKRPITQARIANPIPQQLATRLNVPTPRPPETLFDEPDEDDQVVAAPPAPPNLQIVYIAYVCNPQTQQVLHAWWGIPKAQDEQGHLDWDPEPLPLELLRPGVADKPSTVTGTAAQAFDSGEPPTPNLQPRPRIVDNPPTEPEPDEDTPVDGDE